jgi:hypothetical protein
MYEKISYEGADYGLEAMPLEKYFDANPSLRPKFTGFNTGCMRGYLARWDVRDKKLYLVGMDMVLQTDATFESVFPGAAGGMVAGWVSGDLVCPYGKILRYDHNSFRSIREHELILTFENGILTSSKKIDNAALSANET